MDQNDYTTKRRKGKHLTEEERVIIQTRLKDGWTDRKIAREIGCSPSTIGNEKKRGTIEVYNGNVRRYKAKAGQQKYEENRQNSKKSFKFIDVSPFIRYVEKRFRDDKWSLDAIHGRAVESGKFARSEMVCTKTLYNYVDLGLIKISNVELPEKLKRKQKQVHVHENKRVLGRSIEERDPDVATRQEFGHWEADLVIGGRDKEDDVLLVLLERKSRCYYGVKLESKSADDVISKINEIRQELGERFDDVFKTITTDNGSEFSRLSELEDLSKTLVYYAHPFASCEKGSIEDHNRLLRRFLKKGSRIEDYSNDDIDGILMWLNGLPRKILGYRTPEEIFEDEMNLLYAA